MSDNSNGKEGEKIATLYYIHDPMCSWCWGFRPAWYQLREQLPESVKIVNIVGGLAADTDEPMPIELQEQIQGYWTKIHNLLGTQFNFDFWSKNQPRRATYMSCRAVLAARLQNFEEQMIFAIQQAYYLRALNPSDLEVLVKLARELDESGLDINVEQYQKALNSDEIEKQLQEQISLARKIGHQGFPSLVLENENKLFYIERDYYDSGNMRNQLMAILF